MFKNVDLHDADQVLDKFPHVHVIYKERTWKTLWLVRRERHFVMAPPQNATHQDIVDMVDTMEEAGARTEVCW